MSNKTRTVEERTAKIMARAERIKKELNALAKECATPEFFANDKKQTVGETVRHELFHIVGASQAISALVAMNACEGHKEPTNPIAELFQRRIRVPGEEEKEGGGIN